MAKRKITVTVDEEYVEILRRLDESTSSVVNKALSVYFEHRARNDALGQMLDEWDRKFGPTGGEFLDDAQAAFDEAAGIIPRQTA